MEIIEIIFTVLGSLVLLALVIPMVAYMWGFMFGKGFLSSMAEYFNKHKRNKNEQKENE